MKNTIIWRVFARHHILHIVKKILYYYATTQQCLSSVLCVALIQTILGRWHYLWISSNTPWFKFKGE